MSDKEKKIFYFTIFFVLIALFDRLFIGPVLERLKTVDIEIAQQENRIKSDLRILSYKDNIMKESKAYGKYFVKEIKDADVINAQFLGTVEKFATTARVNLIKSNPTETVKHKKYVEYFANLDCSGSLKDVITFMYTINSTDDLLKIVKFNMTPKRGAEEAVNASMTVVKLIVHSADIPE